MILDVCNLKKSKNIEDTESNINNKAQYSVGRKFKKEDVWYLKIYQELNQKFPNTFIIDRKLPKKILKIGISKDLKDHPAINWNELYTKFIFRYCTGKRYVKAHVTGAKRYDLEGIEVGEVTEAQYYAKQKIIQKIYNQKSKLKNKHIIIDKKN